MRNLNPEDIDQLITVGGMVIRTSSLIPEMREGDAICVCVCVWVGGWMCVGVCVCVCVGGGLGGYNCHYWTNRT